MSSDTHDLRTGDRVPLLPQGPRVRRVFINSLTQAGGAFFVVAIGLVVTPFAITRLGLVQFGIWSYATVVVAYIAIADPGLAMFVTRRAAQVATVDDRLRVARIVGFGIGGWFALLAIGLPAFIPIVHLLVDHLHLDSHVRSIAGIVLLWAYGYLFVSIVGRLLSGVLIGIGDIWLAAVIDAGSRLIYGVVAIVLLLQGHGIWAMVVATSLQASVALLASAAMVKSRFGPIVGNPFRLDRAVVRELMGSGGWYQLAQVLYGLNVDTDPLVIGTFVGPVDVGIYGIANRLARLIGYLPGFLQTSVLREAASAATPSEDDRTPDPTSLHGLQREVLKGGMRFTTLIGFAIAGFIVGLSPAIYASWLGRSYPDLYLATLLVVSAAVASNVGLTCATLLFAIGETLVVAKLTMYAVLANVAFTFSLVIPLGMNGVLIGTVAAFATSSALLMNRTSRSLGFSVARWAWPWLWRLAVSTSIIAGACRVALSASSALWARDRPDAVGALVAGMAMYAAMWLVSVRATSFFRTSDVTHLERAFPAAARLLEKRAVRWIVSGHPETAEGC